MRCGARRAGAVHGRVSARPHGLARARAHQRRAQPALRGDAAERADLLPHVQRHRPLAAADVARAGAHWFQYLRVCDL